MESVWEVTKKDLPFLKEQIRIILDDFYNEMKNSKQ